MSEAFILIDFDNLDRSESGLGVEHIVRKVFRLCDQNMDQSIDRVRARLYGGWYENGVMTRSAQRMIREISVFGVVRCVRHDCSEVLISVELANSLLADPATLVDNTFRKRAAQKNLSCKSPPWSMCIDPVNCVNASMHPFAASGCSTSGCSVLIADVLERNEQKVVDSMLVADLIETSLTGFGVVLVSRDDDMWPGLRMAAQRSAGLVHLLTTRSSRLPNYYSVLRGTSYRRITWS